MSLPHRVTIAISSLFSFSRVLKSVMSGLLTFALIAPIVSLLLPQDTIAQIPTDCTDALSLESSVCCPTTADGVCGEGANRGTCVTLDFPGYSNETSNVRVNWPHYFTRVCECNRNYAGHDCSRCKFGYFGVNCSEMQVLPRKPIRDLSDQEWMKYIDILRKTKTYNSGYKVVLEESIPGNASLVMSDISLYNLYIWIHHYTAKDSKNPDPGNVVVSLFLVCYHGYPKVYVLCCK